MRAPRTTRRKLLATAAGAAASATLTSAACDDGGKSGSTATATPFDVLACAEPTPGADHNSRFGCEFDAGAIGDLLPGQKRHFTESRAWLVRFDAEQAARTGAAEGSILALYHRCTHLGCTVPWIDDATVRDATGEPVRTGLFHCPCHGAEFDDAGRRVAGPAPRSLDTFSVRVEGGRIFVDTNAINNGDEHNERRAVVAPVT